MAKTAKQETKTAHTPGPWRAEFPARGARNEMSSIYAKVRDGDQPWRVAYVLREDNPNQRLVDDANARLIAAAPELLALLQQFLEAWDMDGCECDPHDRNYPRGCRGCEARALLERIDGARS